MPASRSARAMILAPRSWPSRPGLATTTRIFRLLAADIDGGSLLDDELHPLVRGAVDLAVDRVGATAGHLPAVDPRALDARAELHGPALDRDGVEAVALEAPG